MASSGGRRARGRKATTPSGAVRRHKRKAPVHEAAAVEGAEPSTISSQLGPSVGVELRGLLSQSDPRREAPRVYEALFGKIWPVVPGPRALAGAHLTQMARDVRDAVRGRHPRLLGRLRALASELRKAGLEPVTRYRVWIGIRFLVERHGHSEAVEAFRESAHQLANPRQRAALVAALERLRRAMEAPPGSRSRVRVPGIAYGWPPELRQLANCLAQLVDVEGLVERYVTSAEVRLICEDPEADGSVPIDPVVHVAVRALDRVLELDAGQLTARTRRRLIGSILDTLCPQGYRSDDHPFGPREPTSRWSDARIRQHVEIRTAMEEIAAP